MNHETSRAELKNSARELLRGKYPSIILTILLVSFLSSGIKSASALLILPDNLWGNLLYYTATVLFWAVSGMFSAGIALFFLNICCRKIFNITDLFYGFTFQPKKVFLVSLIFSVLNLLCSLPLLFVTVTAGLENMELYLKETGIYFAASLGCNVLYLLATLLFTQVYYILLDFPELSVPELFRYSLRLMKENAARYLLLEISFIPLLLLGIGSCGIGFLWIVPYIHTTHALFYLNIVSKKTAS